MEKHPASPCDRTRRPILPALLLSAFAFHAAAQGRDVADIVLHNGKILTVDAKFSVAQAVAVKSGAILAVGRNAEVLRTAGPATRRIDLAGATVVPGLFDGHAHMDREGLKYLYPSLEGARSIDDILQKVAAEVKKAKPGEWVVTMPVGDPPYYQNVPGILKENRLPTRWELDTVSPDNPVYIRGIWGFWNRPPILSIANSQALKLAGITRDTAPPYDGVTIFKDAGGEPNGIFSEADNVPTLEFSLFKSVPRFDHGQRVKALRDSLKRYNAAGTTSIYEGHGVASEIIRAYKELWGRNELTVRSYLVVSPTPGKNLAPDLDEMMRDWGVASDGPGFGDGMLKIGGVFLQAGGNPSIARLLKAEAPYTAWGAYYYDSLSPTRFREMATLAARHGIRVNTTAGSPGAVEDALAVFSDIDRIHPIGERRWVIEHVSQFSPKNVDTMKRLGIVTTAIPPSTLWKGGSARVKALPEAARERYAAYKDLIDGGVPLVLATDNVPPRPFFALWAAIARTTDTGELVAPAQKLSREQALRAMTMHGAYLTFEEKQKGSIEKGKYADLVVIREDFMTMPEERIKDIAPLMTLVGGRIVHERK
ncbi:MAG: amidohydrolase [Betaproteobacteria bacterium]|nr:amidohydrolase [Betaproteobacteria bacterium]